uniref:Uncharacterized protein n=1 Tax=Panagrolaimus sp. ES5 TaxID=591445 RepID=A0AC34FHX3_9BILA
MLISNVTGKNNFRFVNRADCVLLTTVQQLSSTTPSPNVSTSVVQSKPPTKPVTVITSQEKATTEIKASVTNEEYNEYLKIAEQNNWPQDEAGINFINEFCNSPNDPQPTPKCPAASFAKIGYTNLTRKLIFF